MWSIKVEVLLVILVGQSINWLRPYIEQNSLYLFISGNKPYHMTLKGGMLGDIYPLFECGPFYSRNGESFQQKLVKTEDLQHWQF